MHQTRVPLQAAVPHLLEHMLLMGPGVLGRPHSHLFEVSHMTLAIFQKEVPERSHFVRSLGTHLVCV